MKKSAVIVCNNKYVGKAIIALKIFKEKNSDFDLFILGTKFSKTSNLYFIL